MQLVRQEEFDPSSIEISNSDFLESRQDVERQDFSVASEGAPFDRLAD